MSDPHQRCVCGHRRFRQNRTKTEAAVQRWMLFEEDLTAGGFGATPFGTYFGAGDGSGAQSWGRFEATYASAELVTTCESCQRVRRVETLGGVTPLGVYVQGAWLYVAAADVSEVLTCYEVRLDGADHSYNLPLGYVAGIPPAIVASTPDDTAPAPPAGEGVVDTLLRTRLPEVAATGSYLVTLVDRCCGCEVPLATIDLESPPMIFVPQQADLGAPELWLRQDFAVPLQKAAGSIPGIPLEYCEQVLEYDARFGLLPADQGWTHQDAGGGGAPTDFQLIEGGVLQAVTPGSSNPSYWEATAALDSAPSRVHGYAKYLWETGTSTPEIGEGLAFQALAGETGNPYFGASFVHRGTFHPTRTNQTVDEPWPAYEIDRPAWHVSGMSADASNNQFVHDDRLAADLARGTTGSATANELVARFGDIHGNGFTAHLRRFVVSTPGRFFRPVFRAYTQVADPRLRLYLVADKTGSGIRTARFKVRYGVGTADPYTLPPTETGGTVNFADTNTVYELPLDLTGLTPNAPMWFSVERDWAHSDDRLDVAARLIQATVRAN